MNQSDSLKEQMKRRFVDDVIVASAKDSQSAGLILILDSVTAVLLTHCMTLSELILAGVTAVENIDKVRKAFPSFKGVYFLSPNQDNLDRLQADFEPKRLYKSQHVFFTKQMPETLFQQLKSKSFTKKLGSLKEMNLDFLAVSDNVFFSSEEGSVDQQADSLISVLATQQDVSQVELFRINGVEFSDSNQLFKVLSDKTKSLLPYLGGSGKGLQVKVFLFERGFDLLTPLMHDFHYESMLTDFLEQDSIVFSSDNGKNSSAIDSNDRIYRKFRYEFVKEFMKGVSEDFDAFVKTNATAKAQKNKDNDMGLAQMQNVVRGIGEYNETVKQFRMHVDWAKKVMDKINKAGLREVGNAEQTVATGVTNEGEVVNSKAKVSAFRKSQEALSSPENKLRLTLIANAALYKTETVPELDLTDQQKSKVKRHQMLLSKFGKFMPESVSAEYAKEVKRKLDESPSDLQRFISKAEYCVTKVLRDGSCSLLESVRHEQKGSVGDKKGFSNNMNTLFKAKINSNQPENSDCMVIVYFCNNVSYAEIGSLMRIKDRLKRNLRMVIGSTEACSPKQFIQKHL